MYATSLPAGKTGIVDYTNYDDMKYAVSYSFPYLYVYVSRN